MNERIKELANRLWAEEYWTNPNTDKLLPAQLNKFAEMIVRECIQVVDDTQTGNQEMNIGLVMASAAIISHFGVEE